MRTKLVNHSSTCASQPGWLVQRPSSARQAAGPSSSTAATCSVHLVQIEHVAHLPKRRLLPFGCALSCDVPISLHNMQNTNRLDITGPCPVGAESNGMLLQEAQAPSPGNRSDSSELAASVGEMAALAGDSEEGILLLARKVFGRMFEVTGLRYVLRRPEPVCICALPTYTYGLHGKGWLAWSPAYVCSQSCLRLFRCTCRAAMPRLALVQLLACISNQTPALADSQAAYYRHGSRFASPVYEAAGRPPGRRPGRSVDWPLAWTRGG